MLWSTRFPLMTLTIWNFSNSASIHKLGHTFRAWNRDQQVPCSCAVHQVSRREKRCKGERHIFLGSFLTFLLCCERCWQTPPTLALRNVSSACSMPLLERIREGPSGTTLSWQCSRSTTNAISELLLFCVCVCDEIYIYICPLLPRRARGVCALWIWG